MGADVLNNLASQLEVVLPEIQEIHAAFNDQLYGKVKATMKVEKISRYLFRWALEKYIGGNHGKVTLNGGALLPGNGLVQTYLLAGYIDGDVAFRVTEEQTNITGGQQAITDIVARQIAKSVVVQQAYDDVTFHQDGTGILTASSSAVTATTMTFAAANDFIGVNKLFEGMTGDVWDSTAATKRALATGAPLVIIAIDYDARTVTFDQTVTGITAGDIITLQALDTYGPSTPASFQSGYPGTVGAVSAGIGGDSWRHGFKYMTDPTGSNYFYSRQKSTIPQLLPVRVNANNDSIQWEHGLRLIAKAKQRRPGQDIWKQMVGIAHGTQRAGVFELGMSISQNLISGESFGVGRDLVPTNQENFSTFQFANITHYESTRQHRDTIDYISFEKLGRAEITEIKPYSVGGKQYFEGRNSSGTIMTYQDWHLISAYDNVCFDSGVFGRIDTLGLPSAQWDA